MYNKYIHSCRTVWYMVYGIAFSYVEKVENVLRIQFPYRRRFLAVALLDPNIFETPDFFAQIKKELQFTFPQNIFVVISQPHHLGAHYVLNCPCRSEHTNSHFSKNTKEYSKEKKNCKDDC